MGAAIEKIIQYRTLRGKFSSVSPDLAADGIIKVDVEEEGLRFIKNNKTGDLHSNYQEFLALKKEL